MRVLFLSYDGLTDPLGGSQILPYLTGLAIIGHEIDIISFEKPHRWKQYGSLVKTQCKEAGLRFFPQLYRKNPPILSTLLDIDKMKQKAAQLQKRKQYDIVHCRSYIPALAGRWMQKRYAVKFIFDMRGFYADERVDGGIWPANKWIYRRIYKYFKKKETEFIQHANHTISLTTNAKKEILKWNILENHDRISVIPCCADTKHFSQERIDLNRSAELKADLKINDNNLVVGYIGSVGTWYLLEDMLLYFKKLVEKYPQSIMLFLTYDDPNSIRYTAKTIGLDPALLRIKAVHRNELPSYMALFDWSIFFIQPVFSKKASSPTKQGELMSMGIPVVCNAQVGDTEEIVRKYDAGICLENTSEEQLTIAVHATDQLLTADRFKIITGANEYFSLEDGIAAYHQIYLEVMK